MKYFFTLLMLMAGYYTFSYGIFQWKKENNKLGAFGTIMFALLGTIIPVIFLIIRF